MSISVVMPVYNEKNYELYQSINSVLNQTESDFKFIIINDNPKSSRVFKFLRKISHIDSRIKIINNSRRIGPSASVNKAVSITHSKFIARMDADDICKKNRLKQQLNFLLKNNLDLCCSNFCGFIDRYKISNNKPYYDYVDIINQNKMKDILSHSNIAMGPTLFFKRDSFINIHGYRSMLSEDYDLITRFIINHFRVGYKSSVVLYKRNRRNNLSNNNGLDEFVSTYLISKTIRNYRYKQILSLSKLKNSLSKIKKKDRLMFLKFTRSFEKYKITHSLFYLIESLFITFSSFMVLKRNLWMFFTNVRTKNNV